MSAGSQNTAELLFCKARSYRQSAAEALCGCQNVRLYADIFPSIELTCSADACLHFVEYENNIVFIAKLSYVFYIIARSYYDSTLALYNLKYYRANRSVEKLGKHFFVACLGIFKAAHKRHKILVVVLLPRCSYCSHGSAVERIHKRYYRISVFTVAVKAVFSRKLYGALICLRSGIAKKHLIKSAFFAQKLCRLGNRLVIIEI